jgi:hypothetical protein
MLAGKPLANERPSGAKARKWEAAANGFTKRHDIWLYSKVLK